MGQVTQDFVDRAIAICKENRYPPITLWEVRQLLYAWNDREALRANIEAMAVMNNDLHNDNDALRARVAELEAALRHIADSGTDYDSPAWASRRAAQALGVAGNKTEVPK